MKDTILYIDDEQNNLDVFEAFFGEEYHVITLISTEDAEKYLGMETLKLIISDQRMKNETGLEFFERIRDKYPDPVFIIFTAFADIGMVLQAINLGGIYRYMIKPWNHNEMVVNIKAAINHYNLCRENKNLLNNIKESEARYRQITDTITDYIYKILVSKGKVIKTLHSENCFNILGYKPFEFENDHQLWYNIIFDPDKEIVINFINEVINNGVNNSIEYRVNHKNGTIRWVSNTLVLIKTENNTEQEYDGIIKDITEKKQLQLEMVNAVFNAEEKERAGFAKDLHDGVGSVLSIMHMYVKDWQSVTDSNEKNEISTKILDLLNECIQQIVEISHAMSPHMLKNHGLPLAIESFSRKIESKQNPCVDFQTDLEERIDSKIEYLLFRITTELINNTLKYAKARKIRIGLYKKENIIQYNYADDGIGISPERLNSSKLGMGLYNIKNRIEILNGIINFSTSPGHGFSVEIFLRL